MRQGQLIRVEFLVLFIRRGLHLDSSSPHKICGLPHCIHRSIPLFLYGDWHRPEDTFLSNQGCAVWSGDVPTRTGGVAGGTAAPHEMPLVSYDGVIRWIRLALCSSNRVGSSENNPPCAPRAGWYRPGAKGEVTPTETPRVLKTGVLAHMAYSHKPWYHATTAFSPAVL